MQVLKRILFVVSILPLLTIFTIALIFYGVTIFIVTGRDETMPLIDRTANIIDKYLKWVGADTS